MSSLFPSVPSLSTESMSEQISDLLRLSIVQGVLKPGQRLIEKTIAQELQVSRTPVREALRTLEAEGLVENIPRKGSSVRRFSIEEVEIVYDLRAFIEGYGITLAANRIGRPDLLALTSLCASFEPLLRAGEDGKDGVEVVRKLIELNREFHGIIIRCSGSDRLVRTMHTATELPGVLRAYFWFDREHRCVSHEYHLSIVSSLEERDAKEAHKLMHEHIMIAKQFILRTLEKRLHTVDGTE